MSNQASVHLCNLLGRGHTMEEAKAIIAGTNTPPSVATVGTDGASAPEGATEGEPKAPVGPTLVQPDPETSPPEGDKPAWMP